MKAGKLGRLIGQNILRNRRTFAFSSIGILVGISALVFFVALGAGIKRVVATEIFPLDANRLLVVPRTAQFGSLSGGKIIDEQALEALRAIEGVREIYPRMELAFLATTAIDGRDLSPGALELLKRVPGLDPRKVDQLRSVRMWLEIMGNGIDPRLVAGDVEAGVFADPPEGEPIPILLSKRMVEIYNTSFAQARSLPQLSESLLPFIPPFPLKLNHSFISRSSVRGPPLEAQMKPVGLSRYAIMGGITIPLETARKLNARFAGERAAHTYDAVVVEVGSSDQLGPAQEAIGRLGYDIDLSERRMAEGVGLAVMVVTLLFSLISLIIVGIAAINIGHTFFMIIYERKRELGLLRALGASRGELRLLILGESTIIGLVGGALGLGLGIAACALTDLLAAGLLPDFPFKPESFFSFPAWLLAGSLGCAVLFCWLGAFFPARRASRMDPARALAER